MTSIAPASVIARVLTSALACLPLIVFAAPANAYDRRVTAESREYSYSAILPGCEDTGVLGKVTSRFEDRERDYRNSTLSIVELRNVRTVAFRPNGLDLIPRRYCTATAITSDNVKRRLDYFVVEDASIIGWSYNVEWCVSGLDFSYSYDGRCRAARP